MTTLNEITTQLGTHYRTWKLSEKRKDELKKNFFELASKELNDIPATIVKEIEAFDEDHLHQLIKKEFPNYLLKSTNKLEKTYQVVLEENPDFKPFLFINKEDGYVYQRSITRGSPILDDERLKKENPELWNSITEPVRQLKPFDTLDPALLTQLSKYMYSGPPQIKLAAPRKAKPEELE